MEGYMEKNFFRGSALATWLGFTATFAARPLGGMFLGILSDTLGRKVAVVVTVIGMLSATVGQGLLPTPRRWGDESAMADIGIGLLFSLRLVQGLCTGGEIGAVTTYITEVSAQRSMGLCVAFISMTANAGFMFARLAVWGFQSYLGEHGMLDWGWRYPFILAIVPGLISVWGRLFCLKESELFEEEHSHNLLDESGSELEDIPRRKSTRRQVMEFACTHFYAVLIGTGSVVSFAVFQYGGLVWSNSFLKKHGAPPNYLMMAGTCSRLLQMATALPVGWLADMYGTALVIFAGALIQTLAGLPLFMALASDPSSVANLFATYTVAYSHWTILACVLKLLKFFETGRGFRQGRIRSACQGVVANLQITIYLNCAELFPTAVRNLGVGVSYNIGFGLFGGFAPLVAEASLEWTPFGPGIMLSLAGLVTCMTILASVRCQRAGMLQLAHIRPRPYMGTWADGEANGELDFK